MKIWTKDCDMTKKEFEEYVSFLWDKWNTDRLSWSDLRRKNIVSGEFLDLYKHQPYAPRVSIVESRDRFITKMSRIYYPTKLEKALR